MLFVVGFRGSVARVVDPVCLGGSQAKHVDRHAAGKHHSGISASVHHGRVGKNGGGGNQSALLGELVVSLHATDPESERKRSPEDADERDEERALLPPAADQEQPTWEPLFSLKRKRPQTTS